MRADILPSRCAALGLALAALTPACAPSRPAAPAASQPETESQKPKTDLYGDPLPPGAIARMGTRRLLLGGSVLAVAISPDGILLATGHVNNSIRIWEIATGKELRTIEIPGEGIGSVAFSPDGKTLATGGIKGSIFLWETYTGKELLNIAAHAKTIRFIVFSPDGKRLASASVDGCIRLSEAATEKGGGSKDVHGAIPLHILQME